MYVRIQMTPLQRNREARVRTYVRTYFGMICTQVWIKMYTQYDDIISYILYHICMHVQTSLVRNV